MALTSSSSWGGASRFEGAGDWAEGEGTGRAGEGTGGAALGVGGLAFEGAAGVGEGAGASVVKGHEKEKAVKKMEPLVSVKGWGVG